MEKYTKMKSETVSRMVVEPSRFRYNFLQLKNDSILTDIVITCNDTSIPAHKCILSASSLFFKLLFMGTTKSPYKNLDTFDMSDILDNVKVIESIIDFTYTGSINMDPDNFANIVGLSYFLAMHDLTEICTRYLGEALNKDNCLQMYLKLYKSELVMKERDSAPFMNRETDVMQTVWDMVESKFYDHIILQEDILQLSTEDMLHLLSKGIVKNFSVETVLEFTIRWLKVHRSDDTFEIAEMFLNLAHERVQLSSHHEDADVNKERISVLAHELDEVVLVCDLSDDQKANINTKLVEIEVLMEASGDNVSYPEIDDCETKQEIGVDEEVERPEEEKMDIEIETYEGDGHDNKVSDEVVVGKDNDDNCQNGVIGGDDKDVENECKKDGEKDGDKTDNNQRQDGGVNVDEAAESSDVCKENEVVPESSAGNVDDNASKANEITPEPSPATVKEAEDCVAPEAETAVEENKGVYDSDTDDLEIMDFEPVMLKSGHGNSGALSDTDEEDGNYRNKKKMSPLDKVKMLNFEKSVKDRVAKCLKTQTQKFVNKILKNSKLTTMKRTTAKPRKRIITIEDKRTRSKRHVKKESPYSEEEYLMEAADLDGVVADVKQEAGEKRESDDALLISNLYVHQDDEDAEDKDGGEKVDSDQDYDEAQEEDSDSSVDIHPVRVGRSARKKRKVSRSPAKRRSPVKKEKKESASFTCEVCDKTFTRSSRLKIHLNIHRGVKPYRCIVCGMMFGRGYHVVRHMNRKHADVKSFECDVCKETFDEAKDIVSHARGHVKAEEDTMNDKKYEVFADITTDTDGKKTYNCKVCKKVFSRSCDLSRHLTSHTGERAFHCNYDDCRKGFSTKLELKAHTDAVHLGISMPAAGHKCEFCKRVYQTKENYDKHAEKCNGVKHFQCDECGASFYRQYHLDRHRLVHTAEKPFACTECSSAFKREHKLKEHMKKHTGETVNRQVICELCGAVLKDIKYLRRHLDSHDGTKRHQCQVCLKNYTQAIGLKIHMRIHTGLKPYQCEICSMLFSVKSNLMRHQRRHRGDRKHKCDKCGKGFVMAGDLRRHYTMHTGEKNFPCRFCGKKFSSKSKVPQHERIHTGEKPYECQICGKRFIQNGDRKRHELTHGGKSGEKPKRQLSLYEIANGVPDEEEAVASGHSQAVERSTAHHEIVDRMTEIMSKHDVQETGIDMSMNDGRRGAQALNMMTINDGRRDVQSAGMMSVIDGRREVQAQGGIPISDGHRDIQAAQGGIPISDGRRDGQAQGMPGEYENQSVYSAQNPNSSLFLAAFATGSFNY